MMANKHLFFCLVLFACVSSKTPYSSLIETLPNIPEKSPFSENETEIALAKKVYQELQAAEGRPAPNFRVDSMSASRAAYYDAEQQEIVLELKALKVCFEFGNQTANALAAILGHELGHYYLAHGLERGLISNDSTPAIVNRRQEETADIKGGFMAYQAGYPTFDIMPRLLERIYEAYQFDTVSTKYPSLLERQDAARLASDTVKVLSQLLEVANHLLLIEEVDLAKMYYTQILGFYKGREIYNNLGICTAYEAFRLFTNKEQAYLYPLQVDMDNRINASKGNKEKEKRNEVLKEAFRYFQSAIQLDATYTLGYINAACMLDLMEESERKKILSNTFPIIDYIMNARVLATRDNKPQLLASTYILEGIKAAKTNDFEMADLAFHKAQKLEGTEPKFQLLAQCNIDILKRTAQNESVETSCLDNTQCSFDNVDLELIDGHTCAKPNIRGVKLETLWQEQKLGALYNKKFSTSNIFRIRQSGKKSSFLIFTDPSYSKASSKGIKIGAKKKAVLDAYGICQERKTSKGEFLIYDSNGIAFFIDRDSKCVNYWFTY